LSVTRGQRCSELIRYDILYDIFSLTQGDDARALAEFALS